MKAMEDEMGRLRVDAKAQTDALIQLRNQIAKANDAASQERTSQWLQPLLLGLVVLLAGLAAWFALRLRRTARQQQGKVWWDGGPASVSPSVAAGDDSAYAPSTHSSALMPVAPSPRPAVAHQDDSERDDKVSPLTVPAPTAVTIPPLRKPPEASRAVSVDEQIDLEQQADFFVALGHDEAAIDLLLAHLRSTGGGSPLPYLKLLEIHRRRGEREAYERLRVRFNQRFNSVAPDWQSDPLAGRSLDDYAQVIGRLQRAWPIPLDAMAELEALLFRRGADAELFDLPAYQEVLFLYQMARDLHQADQPAVPTGEATDVDVLLPIGGAAASTIETADGTISLRSDLTLAEPASLDLDLSRTYDVADLSRRRGSAVDLPKFELDLEPAPEVAPVDSGDDPWGIERAERSRLGKLDKAD